MQLLKKLLYALLPLFVIATVVNDCGQYFKARYDLSNITKEAADASAASAHEAKDRNASWQAGETVAQTKGATVYGYDVTDNSVHVWTRSTVRDTWALHYIAAVASGDKTETPLVIDDEAYSVIR